MPNEKEVKIAWCRSEDAMLVNIGTEKYPKFARFSVEGLWVAESVELPESDGYRVKLTYEDGRETIISPSSHDMGFTIEEANAIIIETA